MRRQNAVDCKFLAAQNGEVSSFEYTSCFEVFSALDCLAAKPRSSTVLIVMMSSPQFVSKILLLEVWIASLCCILTHQLCGKTLERGHTTNADIASRYAGLERDIKEMTE